MRHVFAVNPYSGKGKWLEKLLADIHEACAEAGVTPEIYKEPDKEGMLAFVRAAAQSGEPVRVYACGGDGTIFCVVNAVFGFENVEIAAVPYGSGNDFVKLFGEKEQLRDIRRHLGGTPHRIDAIKCGWSGAGQNGEAISVNICSMGFDAEVNARQADVKKIPLVSGQFAYMLSLLSCIPGKFYSDFTVQVDDEPPVKGTFLFAIGGNSRWYGGGFQSCPKAIPDDGLLDCVTVAKAFGRLKMITMIGTYKKGEHLDNPDWPFARMRRGKVMRVHADTPAAVNIDGETRIATDVTFELLEKAVCYVVPEGSGYFAKREAGTL